MKPRVVLLIAEFLNATKECEGAGFFVSDGFVEFFFVVAERLHSRQLKVVVTGSAAQCERWCQGLYGQALSILQCVWLKDFGVFGVGIGRDCSGEVEVNLTLPLLPEVSVWNLTLKGLEGNELTVFKKSSKGRWVGSLDSDMSF